MHLNMPFCLLKFCQLLLVFTLSWVTPTWANVDTMGNKNGPVFGGELTLLVAEPFGIKGYMLDLGQSVGRMDRWDVKASYEVNLTKHGWSEFVSAVGVQNLSRLRWTVVASTMHYGPRDDVAAYWGLETTVARFDGWGEKGPIKRISSMQGRLDTLSYSINGQLSRVKKAKAEEQLSFWTTEQNRVFNPGDGGWAPDWGSEFPGEASGELGDRLDMYRYGANADQTEGTWFKYPGFWQLTREGRLTYELPRPR